MRHMAENLPICETHKKPGWIITDTITVYGCPKEGCGVVGNEPGRCPKHDVNLVERGERQVARVVCEDCFR